MLNPKEIGAVIIISIILGFLISLIRNLEIFLYSTLLIFLVISINLIAKKIMSYNLDTEIDVKLWEFKRWGFRTHHYFKKPFPIGILLPILTTVLSVGYVVWSACLTFEVKAKKYRAARRHGLYTFSEITENHIGLIAASGIIINLLFALLSYLIGLPDFARLNIYYAFFNMIPVGNLDGNKIFFGNLVLWSFLAAITLIALGFSILLV